MTSYLDAIDSRAWPGIAHLPGVRFSGIRLRKVEADFAKALLVADISADGPAADIKVLQEGIFRRIAAHGWLGLAESFLAGEWVVGDNSPGLSSVLKRLIASGYCPSTPLVGQEPDDGQEVPLSLVKLYAGDGVSPQGGIFATGVPTTVRAALPAFSPGPKTHFVDRTTLSAPTAVDRDDLAEAQRRAATWLVDAAQVNVGSHVLVYPATGLQAAVQAAQRRAVVDVLTADVQAQQALTEYLVLAGAADNVAISHVAATLPGPNQWRGRYDAIVSVDKLHILDPHQRQLFVRTLERLLAPSGRIVMQLPVATETMTRPARAALTVLRGYMWPGFDLPSISDVHRLVERESALRIIAQSHLAGHSAESVRQQASYFQGRLREAAAGGYDAVFRRLWAYQFALREALLELGMVDEVQFTMVRRHRGGQR